MMGRKERHLERTLDSVATARSNAADQSAVLFLTNL